MAQQNNKGFQLEMYTSDTSPLIYSYEVYMEIDGTSDDSNAYQSGPVMPSLTTAATMIAADGCDGCGGTTFKASSATDYTKGVQWSGDITLGGSVVGDFGTGTYGFSSNGGTSAVPVTGSQVSGAEFFAINTFVSDDGDTLSTNGFLGLGHVNTNSQEKEPGTTYTQELKQ